MKKGYIFSWFNSGRNYGQTLQAYALQRVLTDMEYDVKHICFESNRYPSMSVLRKLKDLIRLTKSQRTVQSKFDKFICENMKVTNRLNSNKQVQKFISRNKPDFLICGSDQVWNPYNIHPFYFLANIGDESVRRVAYAVSTCDEKRKGKFLDYPEIKGWIRQIDYIYVRENSGKRIFSDLFDVSSEVVLDPTLLLSGKEWIDKLKLKTYSDNYVLCYAFNLTAEQERIISTRAKELNCKIKYGNIINENDIKKEQWSPIEFLEAILNAKEVFTDSFHGTAFSILFHKNFIVFDNGEDEKSDAYYNIDRMNTLLNLIGLSHRLMLKTSPNMTNKEDIDFSMVDSILNKRRKECLFMLRRSIE